MEGAPVAVAITRDRVVVAGSEDPGGLTAMAAYVIDMIDNESRPISCLPLLLVDEAWRRFEPEAPELAAIRDLSIEQDLWDYRSQAAGLERYLAKSGEDMYVAPLESVGFEGHLRTWTSWTQNVPARLPRAETLGLTDACGPRMIRLWRDVEAVCGPFEEDATLHPSRFTPPSWPDEEA